MQTEDALSARRKNRQVALQSIDRTLLDPLVRESLAEAAAVLDWSYEPIQGEGADHST